MQNNKPLIAAIVATSENRVIGKNNQLPWHLPADLKHFKTLTTGHPIIMGRKTFESIGKPLPDRINIILTRDQNYAADGAIVVTSMEEAIQKTQQHEKVFIIGGAEIYQLFLPFTQKIYQTLVHQTFDGDVFFPEINLDQWQIETREYHAADEKNIYAYSFVEWSRTN